MVPICSADLAGRTERAVPWLLNPSVFNLTKSGRSFAKKCSLHSRTVFLFHDAFLVVPRTLCPAGALCRAQSGALEPSTQGRFCSLGSAKPHLCAEEHFCCLVSLVSKYGKFQVKDLASAVQDTTNLSIIISGKCEVQILLLSYLNLALAFRSFHSQGSDETSTPQKCPAGYFCPPKTGQPTLCPPGYFCPEQSSEPQVCPEGYRSLAADTILKEFSGLHAKILQ